MRILTALASQALSGSASTIRGMFAGTFARIAFAGGRKCAPTMGTTRTVMRFSFWVWGIAYASGLEGNFVIFGNHLRRLDAEEALLRLSEANATGVFVGNGPNV